MTKPILLLLTTLVLSACGGGSSSSSSSSTGNTSNPTPPTTTEPDTESPRMVDFNFQQRSANQAYRSGVVQSANFMNATGQFKLPLNQQVLNGNITISIDINDPDTLTGVYVGFTGTTRALELCTTTCGDTFSSTLTGINPLDFEATSGDQRLELWVNDASGNKVIVDTVDFEWFATTITGINATRNANTIDLSWSGISNYLRYNVYIATEAGVTPDNYQSLNDGQAFLALRDPNIVLNGTEDSRTFYTAVTGIDGSGESAFGQLLQVAAIEGAVDTPPDAVDDSYTIDEDTTLTGNIANNDTDLESINVTVITTPLTPPSNGTLNLNPDGSFSYQPTANFTGRDAFVYQVQDGVGQTDTAVAIITVNQTNDAPQPSFNRYNVLSGENRSQNNGILQVDAPGLLINDLDIDSGTITVITDPETPPSQGTLTLNADGSFRYEITPGATGQDSFSYEISDGNGGISKAEVLINIDGASFPPIAATDRYQLLEDEAFNADNSGEGRMSVISNDIDFDANDTLTVNTALISNAQNGILSLATDGTFSYIPNFGFFGIDSFIYEVVDSQGNLARAGVILEVVKKNNTPVAVSDNYSLMEDTNLSVNATDGVLNNDSDQDFDNLTVELLTQTSNGQISLAANGSFDYTPEPDFFGTDTFTYSLSDGESSTTGTVQLTVTNENDPPVANDDFAQTNNSSQIVINVLENDSDIEGNDLTVTVATMPNNQGSAIINSDSSLTYIPTSGFEGTAEINYTIDDGFGGTDSALVTISVNIANNVPVAVNDSYTIDEDQTLNANGNFAPTLLDNDSDPDGDNLVLLTAPVTDVANGTLTLSGNGSFRYVPDDNFFGNDSFSYQVRDNKGGVATATATITVNSVNDVPIANNDQTSTAEETLININVLANDQDIDNDSLTVISASANSGSVEVTSDNSLNYTPNLNFVGNDTISYTISDGTATDSATVAITVVNVNDNPTAVNDSAATSKNAQVTINVLDNDSDVDGDNLTVVNAVADNGSTVINANNTITYTPNNNFSGFDNLTYTVGDGNGGTATAIVNIEVINTNTGPVAVNDDATTDEDNNITIDVLANDSDSDGDQLSIIEASAQNGQVDIVNDTLSYTPNLNFNGQDQIDYTISDGLAQDSAQVTVTINSVNDIPTANDDSVTVVQNSPIQIEPLNNDTDVEGHTLSITSATANFGNVSQLNSTTLVYQSNADFSGQDTIIYTIVDELGATAVANIFVQVLVDQQPPVAVNDSATTNENTAVTINVLANDSDPNNDPLTVVSAIASNGQTVINTDQTVTYQPNTGFSGNDVINYTISDGNGNNASAIVNVEVIKVNQPPIALNDSATTNQNSAVNINVIANDSDPDGDPLTVTNAAANSGQVIVNPDQSLNYIPNTNFIGNDVINYTISDGNSGTASALVNVEVLEVNQPPVAINDNATTNQNTAVNLNVLANDSDPEGDTLTVFSATANSGQVNTNPDQTLNYRPQTDFTGIDIVNYSISDGNGNTASAIVTIEVLATNQPPVANNDSTSTLQDTAVTINVLANDTDPENDSLTVITAVASQGAVNIQANQTIVYQPNQGFTGSDVINYTISDGNGNTASAIVNVEVMPDSDNNPPVAVNDIATVTQGQSVTIEVLANDSDPDGDTISIITATANTGTVTINDGLTIFYQAPSDFKGSDTINYTITDGNNNFASATVAVTVTELNNPPVANNDQAVTQANVVIDINVLANDSDPDNDQLTIIRLAPSVGTITINTDQTVRYQPQTDFVGTDVFSYTIDDGKGATASAQVSVTVEAQNQAPTANNDIASTNRNVTVNIDVLANDVDPDGDTLTITTASATTGSVNIVDNKLEYIPARDFVGEDTINYSISDGNGNQASATVAMTVAGSNQLPIANPDEAQTDEEVLVVIDVLANDSDPDGDTITIATATAQNGTIAIVEQKLQYTGNLNFSGTDTISYTIVDSFEGSATSSVTVTVNPINDAPEAVDDIANLDEDTSIILQVLANDNDPDNDPLTIVSAQAENGTVQINEDQTLSYQGNQDFNGEDTLIYTISDSQQLTAQAKVVITVNPINDAPVAQADVAQTDEETSVTINVLANDTDAEQDTLTVTEANVQNGVVTISADQTLSYTPNTDFTGDDVINYTISDPSGLTATSTVTVTVNPINDLPIANPDAVTTDEDTVVVINVLANDSDVDSPTLQVTAATAQNGTVQIQPDSQLSYLPNLNFNGSDTINYTIDDGSGGTASTTVTITINAVNDAPVAQNDNTTIEEDTTALLNVLVNDEDVDGDPLTITIGQVSSGGATLSSNNEILYVPDVNFNGEATISYSISDPSGATSAALVNITVAAVNDAPIAVDDNATTNEDTNVTVNVLSNDSDIEQDQLSLSVLTTSNGGAFVSDDGNTITFVPTPNFHGQSEIGYQISDGNGGIDTATLTVTVLSVNDDPVANDDTATINEDSASQFNVLINDTDVDGDQLFVLSAGAANGSVNVLNSNILEYQPQQNYFGQDVINYTIVDSQGGSSSAKVNITIQAVNDAPQAIADFYNINEDQTSSFSVLDNDSDVENETLNIVEATATNGTVTIGITSGVNVLNYQPTANFNGEVTINYTISDNGCASASDCTNDHYASTTVSLFINAVNDEPVVTAATASVAENVAVGHLVHTVVATDIEQDTLSYSIVSGNNDGVFALNQSNGEITVADKTNLDFDKTPQYTLTVAANDGNGGQGTAQITIDVIKVTTSETLQADSSFGNTTISGVAASNAFAFDNHDMPYANAMDSQGRVIVAGSVTKTTTDFAITRYLADGTIDLAFGVQGIMFFDLQSFETVRAITLDSNDNIYLLGDIFTGSSNELVLARISATGQLDTSFGVSGFVTSTLGQSNMQVADIIYQSDSTLTVGITVNNQFQLRRYNATSGSFVESVSFDVGGEFEIMTALAQQSDNQIIVVGHSADSANSFNYDYIVARVNNTTYTLDTSFASTGYKQIDLGNKQDDFAHDVLVAPNGDIAIVGATAFSSGIYDVALAQLDSTGVLNTNIDNDGIMILDADGDGGNQTNSSMAMDVVLHNNSLYVSVQTGLSTSDQNIGAIKIDSGGILDSSFGTNGIAIVNPKSSQNYIAGVMVDSSNRPLLAATVDGTRNQDFALVRMTTTGALDTSFAIDGYNSDNFTASDDEMTKTIELTQGSHAGKFVAVGHTQSNTSVTDALVARYTSTGALDTSFGNDGYFKLSDNSAAAYIANSVKELTDGRLAVAGQFGDGAFVLVLTTEGKLDTSFASTGIKNLNAISNNLQLEIKDLAINNNQITFAGDARDITNDSYDIYLGRIDLNGNFDSSYGTSGEVQSNLSGNETVQQMAIQTDGSIIVVGAQQLSSSTDTRALIAKYTNTGALDTSFNGGHHSLDLDTSVADNSDQLFDIAINNNGVIYASGRSQSTTTNQQALVSITSSGSLNTAFATTGIALYSSGRSSDKPTLTLDSNQRLVLAGITNNTTDGGTDVFIIRITSDGAPDAQFNNGNVFITSYGQTDEVSSILATSTGKILISGQNQISGYDGKVWYLQSFNLVQQ